MPVYLRTRRQIASASNSGSRIAFGGNGSGGGNIVPSLEPVAAPVLTEFGEDGLVTEEDMAVKGEDVKGSAFGEAVDAVADGLRTIRALGGMTTLVVSCEGSDGGRNPFRLRLPTPTYAFNSLPSYPLEPSRRPFCGAMDIDSCDLLDIERNGAASNSDRYITPVEYHVLVLICPLNFVRYCSSIYLDMSLAFKSGILLHSLPAMQLPLP